MTRTASNDIETRHHRVILVFQIVAMQHVAPAELLTRQQHHDFLAHVERHGVFPPSLMNQRWLAIALQNLEVGQMHMRRMWAAHKPYGCFVTEPPEFHLSEGDGRVNAVRIEALAIDRPDDRRWQLAKTESGPEGPGSSRGGLRPLKKTGGTKVCGNVHVVGFAFDHIETHDRCERGFL